MNERNQCTNEQEELNETREEKAGKDEHEEPKETRRENAGKDDKKENKKHNYKLKKQAIEGRQYMRREYQSSHNLKGKNILFVHILLTMIMEF